MSWSLKNAEPISHELRRKKRVYMCIPLGVSIVKIDVEVTSAGESVRSSDGITPSAKGPERQISSQLKWASRGD